MAGAPYDSLPILIGVVGKRSFDPDPEISAGRLAIFSARFRALLAQLEDRLPDTPKALLCGGAAGADLAAARIALERPNWRVILALPFARELFEQDFAEARYAADLACFRALADDHPQVLVKILRPLHREKFDDSVLEPIDTQRYTTADLEKIAGQENKPRSWHFEQLGLWIARNATLLVAAMPAETASEEKPFGAGGSARVVAYRRTSTPDEEAGEVIGRSSELLSNSRFYEPDGGHVLWIDPTQTPAPDTGRLHGVAILRPIQRVHDFREESTDFSQAQRDLYRAPLSDPLEGERLKDERRKRRANARDAERRERGALAVASAFQRGHARELSWRQILFRRPPAAAPTFGPEHPAEFLDQVRDRSGLSRQQRDAAQRARSTLRASALLLLLAVASYEAFTEVSHQPMALALYIVFLLCIFATSELSTWARVQLIAEDFRGVKEMMRVQIAWWSTGIDRLVDRVHLRTVDSDLRLAREAVATISLWSALRCTRLASLDVAALPRARPPIAYAQDWIGKQAAYFHDNAGPQFAAKHLAETLFYITYCASMAALIAKLAADAWAPEASAWASRAEPWAAALLPPAAAAMVAGGLWLVSSAWRGVGGAAARPGWALALGAAGVAGLGVEARAILRLLGFAPALPATIDAIAPGVMLLALGALAWARAPRDVKGIKSAPLRPAAFALGVGLTVATVALATLTFAPHLHAHKRWEAASDLILAQAVLLLASSAVARWYTDRRNHFAQGVKYDDMLRVFRRAQSWLKGCDTLDREAQQRLVELGELALDENEAWLKAHRERPAEPIAS